MLGLECVRISCEILHVPFKSGVSDSTGNSTQYSVMAYVGKESKKKGKRERVDICVCATDSLCCTPETNTTL